MIALMVLAGCGDDGDGGDAGSDASADGGQLDANVVPPDIPWLAEGAPPVEAPEPPVLTPCPPGWREVPPEEAGGPITCDPYPEAGPLDCPDGEAHFPGDPGCAPIGSACPTGEWADGLPDDSMVVFVRAGVTGGEGTRASPLGSIRDAMIRAEPGMTVALGKGHYTQPVTVDLGVTLRGACVRDTVMSPAGPVRILYGGARIADLSIEGSEGMGITVTGGFATLELEGVVISSAVDAAILVDGSGRLVGRELFVTTTRGRDAGGYGYGLDVESGSSAEVSRSIFDRNRDSGVLVIGSGASVELRDTVIRHTLPSSLDDSGGEGLQVSIEASALLERVLIDGNRNTGAYVSYPGSTLEMRDSVVRGTLSRVSDGQLGRGVHVATGAAVTLSRVLLEDNQDVGATVDEPGASLSGTDVLILATRSSAAGRGTGVGVAVTDGASASLGRALISGNRTVGVYAEGGAVSLTDTTVSDTLPREVDSALGIGLTLLGGATGDVSAALFERNHVTGIAVIDDGSSLHLTDAVVHDTLGRAGDGRYGRGIVVQQGATAELSHVLVDGCRDVGLAVLETAHATLTDVAVRDTQPRDCAAMGSCTGPAGHNVTVAAGSEVSAQRFLLARSDLCGLLIATDARADLMTGVVSDNPVGVCLQVEGYDVSRLMDHVLYQDNGTTLEATSYPVPEAADPAGL